VTATGGNMRSTLARNAGRAGPVPLSMQIADALTFARGRSRGVLTTLKSDGRPQLSNIVFDASGDRIRISVTAGRAKTANLARDPRASLHVTSDDFWSYVVIEADAELTPVAGSPDDATVDELVELYRAVSGEHDDWDDYRAAMVRDRRLVVRLTPTHAYGALPRSS
jgi:PPOX class probable F420-dependent enzyme